MKFKDSQLFLPISVLDITTTVLIWINALGAYLILGPWGWALIRGGRLLFFHHFQQVRTFLENNKTKDNKFISLQPNKTKCKSEHEQSINSINSSLTVLSLLGGGWALINFWGFQGGRLFEVGTYSRWALIRRWMLIRISTVLLSWMWGLVTGF